MDNITPLIYKNNKLILLLKIKENRINDELQVIQKKYKLLKQKDYLLQKNIELLQYNQKKYQKLKENISKDKEEKFISSHYIIPFLFIKMPFIQIFLVFILMTNIIDNFYKNNSKELDKKCNIINSELESKKLEITKVKKELVQTSNNIKRLQKLLKENQFKQNICYISSRYILMEYDNATASKKLIKNN